jgi:hypothetical protein
MARPSTTENAATDSPTKSETRAPVDGAGIDVAAEIVGAEPVHRRGHAQPLRRPHGERVAGDERRRDGEERDQGEDHAAGKQRRVAADEAGEARRAGAPARPPRPPPR